MLATKEQIADIPFSQTIESFLELESQLPSYLSQSIRLHPGGFYHQRAYQYRL